MGGQQALEWAIAYPARVGNAVVITTTPATSAHTIAIFSVMRHLIRAEPDWNAGDYYGRPFPAADLGAAVAAAVPLWMSREAMEARFGRLSSGYRYTLGLVTAGTADTNIPVGTVSPLASALTGAGTTGPELKELTGVNHLLHLPGTADNDAVLAPRWWRRSEPGPSPSPRQAEESVGYPGATPLTGSAPHAAPGSWSLPRS